MSNNVNAGIYVDGNYVGSGYVSMQVPLGYHTISVDDVVWNDYQQCYSNFFCWWDSNTGLNGYSNSGTWQITANDYINFYYLP